MAGDTIKFLIEMRDSASGPLKKVGKAADQSGKDAKTATTKYTELSSKFHLLGMAAGAAKTAISLIAKPMNALSKGGIAAGAEMEGFETRLKVLMGSSSEAKKRLDELFTIGSTTPFQLPGLMEAEVNLRALGVNAEETLPLVMDFAGAMGVDVARAAVEVGRAMQFGAGAVETIAGRALRAQVELKTGGDALKMSTEEFREAMVATLTDKDGIFKGGTQELAATFDGMVSNMQDAWFKFTKNVGEAGLFLTAKATLITVLELLGKNEDATKGFARTVSTLLVSAFYNVIDAVSGILRIFTSWMILIKTIALGFRMWVTTLFKTSELATEFGVTLIKLKNLMPTTDANEAKQREEQSKKLEEHLLKVKMRTTDWRLENAKLHQEIFELQETYDALGTGSEEIIERIKKKTEELEAANKKAAESTGSGKGKPIDPLKTTETIEESSKKKSKEETGPTPEEIEKGLKDSLRQTESLMKQSLGSLQDLQYKLSPAGLAEGLVNKLTDSFGALTSMMGPAGGLLQGLSDLGKTGADQIVKALKGAIQGLIVGLVEVLPQLIVDIPRAIIDAVPDLIEGIFLAIPALVEAILIGLPTAIFEGLARWFKIAWETIKNWLGGDLFKKGERGREARAKALLKVSEIFNPGALFKKKKHAGTAHIDRTGAFLLQAGEAVVPNSGTTTQGMARRMGGGGGMNFTINTAVVDQNSIRGLGKLLEQEFSSFGRSTSPLFNSPTGSRG